MRFSGAITFLFAASTALASPLGVNILGNSQNITDIETSLKNTIRTGLKDIVHTLHLDDLAPKWSNEPSQSQGQDHKRADSDSSKDLLSPDQITTVGKDLVDIAKSLGESNAFSGGSGGGSGFNLIDASKIVNDIANILGTLNLNNPLPGLHIPAPSQPSRGPVGNATLDDIGQDIADIVKNADLSKEVPDIIKKLGGGQS